MRKILKNAIRCNKCGDVIVSENVHDYVTCKCGACAVDGGHDYLRRCAPNQDAYTELSEVEEQKEKVEVVAAHLTLFNCVITSGQPQLLEHNDLQWITPAQIPEFDSCPADIEILKKIQK